jgi:hypothetical protein
MPINLREQIESDLSRTLEKEYGLPVVLIDPDGNTIEVSQNDGQPLVGQVLYDTVRINPDTGEEMIVNNPIVSLRRSSLSRVPQAGENWIVKIPTDPSTTAAKEDFIISSTRPPEGGRSIGFIRLYLQRAKQTS